MSSNKTILKNSAFLYLRLLITLAIGLFTTRLVLQAMGVEDFGIYGVIAGLVSMFTFLNSAMSSSTQRYLAYDLGKKDPTQLQKTFTTVLNIHLAIAAVSLLLAWVGGLWAINSFLEIPPERLSAAQSAYSFIVIVFTLGIVQVPFHAAIIANEKMQAFAYISILEAILKLAAAFMLFKAPIDMLIYYSQLLALTAIIVFALYYFYAKKNFPETKYIKYFNKAYYKEILSFSGWNLFGNIASVMRGQGTNILINVFFGVVANAAYAITIMVQSVFLSFSASLQQAINPQIIKSYAENNTNRTTELIFIGSKFSFVIILLLVVPFFVNLDYILSVWLGEVPKSTKSFIQLILLFVLIESLSGSLMTGLQATGRIRAYQSIVGFLVLLNFPLIYICYKYEMVAGVAFIIFNLMAVVALYARLVFIKMHLKTSILDYHVKVLIRLLFLSFLTFIFYRLDITKGVSSSLFKVLSDIFVYSVFILLASYLFVLSKIERKKINVFLKLRLAK